jgi:hypothetical protein
MWLMSFEERQNMSTALLITGMYRSGTSMIANHLQNCGVYLGDNLHPGDVGNPRGYFEDVGILGLHEELLAWSHLSIFPTSHKQLRRPIPCQYEAKARQLLQGRARSDGWGWKECRTTLFLDLWRGVIPDLRILFLVRNPLSVVDSLLRRGTDRIILRRPCVGFRTWRLFNELIRQHYTRYEHLSFLMDIDDFLLEPARATEHLFSKLELELPVRDFGMVFAPGDFRARQRYPSLHLALRFPIETHRCLRLYDSIREEADWP